MYTKNWALITGATGGLGHVLAEALAAKDYNLLLAARNMERGNALANNIKSRFPNIAAKAVYVDMADLTSLDAFFQAVEPYNLSVVMHNAGILVPDKPYTKQNICTTLQVNTLAPAIITDNLIKNMHGGSSVIYTSSLMVKFAKMFFPFYSHTNKKKFALYAASKYASLQLLHYYARQNPKIKFAAADPGVMNTSMITQGKWFDPLADIFYRPFIHDASHGLISLMRCLDTDVPSGSFVKQKKIMQGKAYEYKHDVASRLFSETMAIAREHGFSSTPISDLSIAT